MRCESSSTLAQLAVHPLWAKRKTDFSWDRQFVSCPGTEPHQPPGGGPINSWSQFSRPPLAKAASTHRVFRLCRKQRQCGETEGLGSQVRFRDFTEHPRGCLGMLTSFTGSVPPENMGRVKPMSGDQGKKTSPKDRVWAQKLCFCVEPRNAWAWLSQANRKTFHEALRRHFKKRKVK